MLIYDDWQGLDTIQSVLRLDRNILFVIALKLFVCYETEISNLKHQIKNIANFESEEKKWGILETFNSLL